MLTRQIREYFNNVKKDGQSSMLGHGEQIIRLKIFGTWKLSRGHTSTSELTLCNVILLML